MQKLFARVRQWGRRPDGPGPPYEVLCACGQAVRGVRQARRQVVPCPVCGRPVFVLPRSPLPPPDAAPAPAPPVAGWAGAWRLPLIAAGTTLAILLVLFTAALPFLARPGPLSKPAEQAPDVAALTAAGRRALADGDFHLAAQQFQSALDEGRRRPQSLPPDARRDLIYLQRQSDLLARLSSRSLEEIVQEADLVRHEDEWKARFEADYRGKSVLFDDQVRFDDAPLPDGRRRPVLRFYGVIVGGREARLALEDIAALQPLARERPQRMLFGARLAAVERGPGGPWVVRFEPDSGVLLTDQGAAEAVCPTPLDPELIDVLRRQEEWLRRQAPAD